MRIKYYNTHRIDSYDAHYNLILGERSNGKTYAILNKMVLNYAKNGKQSALIRRWEEDFKGKRGSVMFSSLVENGVISKATKWYLCRYDEKGNRETDVIPFCYGFSLTSMEHDKSTSYPDINLILFDEVTTRNGYINDEFVLFMNVISTIVRLRNDVKIYMCGNTVNKYSPYYAEMGLTNIQKMKPGDIDIYTYGDSPLKVAVEFADSPAKNKPSNVYFAFNNPKLSMITGKGNVWEMEIYPHCPIKYQPKDILYIYFIQFDGNLLQCEIINKDDIFFTFIHRKTTPLKDNGISLIYSPDISEKPNYRRRITRGFSELEKLIASFYEKEKVFYQDNEVGEVVRNYIQWCKTAKS